MSISAHTTATPSHYDKEAKHYDAFNAQNSIKINTLIEKTLAKHQVKTVLDLTCGTGSQVFFLAQRGYQVVGVDISETMLKIAREKAAAQEKQAVQLMQGDMRTTQAGQFDAVVTIFNAIGHLTKLDFEMAIKNIHGNLKKGGLYLFDIFNLSYLLFGDNITRLTIDNLKQKGNTTAREIQYSTINPQGILTSYDIYHEQSADHAPKITHACQTLQVYTAKQLETMLEKQGFKLLQQCAIDGSQLSEHQTECIMTIAQKI